MWVQKTKCTSFFARIDIVDQTLISLMRRNLQALIELQIGVNAIYLKSIR